jgi:hypothetical protein
MQYIRSMAKPALAVDDALDTLVQQFSDPLACLRELVQNSIDAGSRQVDIAFEHVDGVMCIHVDDYGDGMDRAIIDSRLTRLFSSAKDGDMTKIGRFGIGFVSVFALEPEAVCVDTGRGPENWRVLFKADRSFTRIALDEPVDGTRVRIFKTVDAKDFEALRARAREVLTYWCKHVDGELYFDDDLISGPLTLDALLQVSHREEGTEVLVGFRQDGGTFAGFYNKGLTLHESRSVEGDAILAGVAFKVSSRYLEHTLTRDNVLHDDQYERAMKIVLRLVRGPLLDALFDRVRQDEPLAWTMLGRRLHAADALPRERFDTPLFPTPEGRVNWRVVSAAYYANTLLVAPEETPLAKLRAQAGDTVVLGPSAGAAAHALEAALVPLADRWLLPQHDRDLGVLETEIAAQLAAEDLKTAGIRLVHWGTALPERVAVSAKRPDLPVLIEDAQRLKTSFFERKRWLLVNADHPTVVALLPLVQAEPEWVGWMITKLFFLGDTLTVALDSRMAERALARRNARMAS